MTSRLKKTAALGGNHVTNFAVVKELIKSQKIAGAATVVNIFPCKAFTVNQRVQKLYNTINARIIKGESGAPVYSADGKIVGMIVNEPTRHCRYAVSPECGNGWYIVGREIKESLNVFDQECGRHAGGSY